MATRKGVIFHQDNVRPHTYLVTRKKLLELSWEVMPHPPYSPDLVTSDYHLFRSLQNIRFKWGCQKWVDSVFWLQEANFSRERNYETDWKMARGHRKKWSIHNWLMFVICINKSALKIIQKNKMTLLTTQ